MGGQKNRPKFGAIYDNCWIWSQISLERVNISKIGKVLDHLHATIPGSHVGRKKVGVLWSTNKKVIAQIFPDPKCVFSVSWRNFIRHVVGTVFGIIRQVALLRPEFQLPVGISAPGYIYIAQVCRKKHSRCKVQDHRCYAIVSALAELLDWESRSKKVLEILHVLYYFFFLNSDPLTVCLIIPQWTVQCTPPKNFLYLPLPGNRVNFIAVTCESQEANAVSHGISFMWPKTQLTNS